MSQKHPWRDRARAAQNRRRKNARLKKEKRTAHHRAVAPTKAKAKTPTPTVARPRKASAKGGWQEMVKSLAGVDLPNRLEIDGRHFTMVDKIELGDPASEEAHAFGIHNAKDSYKSKQKLEYPNGTTVEDAGRAHVGGYAQYQVSHLTPGKDLLIVRRVDYGAGDYELEFFVDGQSAGVSIVGGADKTHRWRNWPHLVSGHVVTKEAVTVKQSSGTPGRDVNMFRFWMYQPI